MELLSGETIDMRHRRPWKTSYFLDFPFIFISETIIEKKSGLQNINNNSGIGAQ